MEVYMIDLKSFTVNDVFFGARNSHDGFKSMFGEIFSPRDYDKLFILKGGPGTGKSTLLRGLVSFANEAYIDARAVLCSSDVSSLDGVILKKNGKKIAVIDGTAPHMQDPSYPGAIDEIINLGDGFNNRLLESRREEILHYSEEKSKRYKEAYRALNTAKSIFDYIWNGILNSPFYSEAENIAKTILDGIEISKIGSFFANGIYSAFGKNGHYSLPVAKDKIAVNLSGDGLLCSMVLRAIKRHCDKKGIDARLYPDALDDRIAERVCISNTVITYNSGFDNSLALGDYNGEDFLHGFALLQSHYTSLLELAQKSFEAAASAHFSLEKIYSGAVDFKNNDKIFTELCQRTRNILI